MRMVTLQAPANHGPSISVGGIQIEIIDDKVTVFDIYADALTSHGYVKIEGTSVPVVYQAQPGAPRLYTEDELQAAVWRAEVETEARVRREIAEAAMVATAPVGVYHTAGLVLPPSTEASTPRVHSFSVGSTADKGGGTTPSESVGSKPRADKAEGRTPRFQP
jgi:hypothetical protein